MQPIGKEHDIRHSAALLPGGATLNNGCVCDSGCDSCNRLAEAFAVMKHGLEAAVASLSNSVRDMQGGIARELNLETVRAALAQAEKVKP